MTHKVPLGEHYRFNAEEAVAGMWTELDAPAARLLGIEGVADVARKLYTAEMSGVIAFGDQARATLIVGDVKASFQDPHMLIRMKDDKFQVYSDHKWNRGTSYITIPGGLEANIEIAQGAQPHSGPRKRNHVVKLSFGKGDQRYEVEFVYENGPVHYIPQKTEKAKTL